MWVRKGRERNFKPFPNKCSNLQKKEKQETAKVVFVQQKVLRCSSKTKNTDSLVQK